VQELIVAQFDDLPDPEVQPAQAKQATLSATEYVGLLDGQSLGNAMKQLDFVENWVKQVRAETERRLLAGDEVPGFKLVEGRQGNRTWADPEVAEAAMKQMRLNKEAMYDFKLISPTTAEKRAKAESIGPRQWVKLQELIVRKPGKPSVAPASDKRPALTLAPVSFDTDTDAGEELA
jgi:hypothetical protein